MPSAWERLRRMLGPGSPKIRILTGWWVVPPLFKMVILESQIRFAAEHGKLGRVDRFLRGLRPDAWFYLERAEAPVTRR
jgi:hypothetical protein